MYKNKGKILEFAGPLFEDMELLYPYYRLMEEGYEVILAGKEKKEYKGKNGNPVSPDITFDEVEIENYKALVLPGGMMPDKLRVEEKVTDIIKKAMELKIPIAVICHGSQMMIDAKVVEGLKMTSVKNIRTDLENAGAIWVDEKVVVDKNVISSQRPPEIPAWMRKFIEFLDNAE